MVEKIKLKIEKYSKYYNNKTILKDVSLQIKNGEIFCVLGRSGCGKTSILRSIVGLDNQFEGDITIDGIPNHQYLKYNKIGFISQKYNNFPRMSVYENIVQGLDIKNDEEIESILKHFNMHIHKDKYPHQLSGGMNQRIAIIRTILQDTEIICADEPFGALDFINRTKAQLYFRKVIKENNKTAIFVTHDIEEALIISDTICIIGANKLTIYKNSMGKIQIDGKKHIHLSPEFIKNRIKISTLL